MYTIKTIKGNFIFDKKLYISNEYEYLASTAGTAHNLTRLTDFMSLEQARM
jgi:hypothetical protein